MTRKPCAVGMRNAILKNHLNFLQSSFSFEGDSDDELLDEEPELATAMFNHIGGINRIRVRGWVISYQIYMYAFSSCCSNYPTMMCCLVYNLGKYTQSQHWTKMAKGKTHRGFYLHIQIN